MATHITPAQAAVLDIPVSEHEILDTLKAMKKNKRPGPDGFNLNFFLVEFVLAIQSFFGTASMLKETNATALALISKVTDPSSMSDFRPTACCNTTYINVLPRF